MRSFSPVYYIRVNRRVIDEIVMKRVNEDGLRFDKEYDGWSLSADSKLRQYLCKQSDSWCLNENTLKALCEYFDNAYTHFTLRQKCFEYGIPYDQQFMDEEKEDSDEDIDILMD